MQWTPLEGAKEDGDSTNSNCSVSLATETLIRDLLTKPAVSVARRPAVSVVRQEEEFSNERLRQKLAIVCRVGTGANSDCFETAEAAREWPSFE